MPPFTLSMDDPAAGLDLVGGKGASLARMAVAGLPVPTGFHVTTQAYRRFVTDNRLDPVIEEALAGVDAARPASLEQAGGIIRNAFAEATVPEDIARSITTAYAFLGDGQPAVAVRSSATAEDLPHASFAGQLESYLNVSGAPEVLDAAKKCWGSLWTARAIGYRLRQGIDHAGVAVGVVVQELVDADVAGILFTVNPLDGDRGKALVSASWGLGDAVVGGRVTPDEYVIDKKTGRLVEQSIATKEMMTVRAAGTTEDRPVPPDRRNRPVLNAAQLGELNQLGIQVEELYGTPMDVEWALAGGAFAVVQARPITTLGGIPSSEEWPLPERGGKYIRGSIIDLMPNPISPLFETMGLPAYNTGLQRMLGDLIRSRWNLLPDDVVRTIRRYAYMQIDFTARQWFGLLFIMSPRLIPLIFRGPTHFRDEALPHYRDTVERLSGSATVDMSAVELWENAGALMTAAASHLAVLQVDTLGAAAGSEGLFTTLYTRFLKRDGHPDAPAFLMGYDTTPIRAEKDVFDLAGWAAERPHLARVLLDTPTPQLRDLVDQAIPPDEFAEEDWQELCRRVKAHQEEFGYVLYDFDFAAPVPAEDSAPMLESVKMYLRGEGRDPHARQAALERSRLQATEDLVRRARGLRGWAVRKALGWAQRMAEVREDSIASVGLAYPRLRQVLRELGTRLTAAGAIDQWDDVFWLEAPEVKWSLARLDDRHPIDSMRITVEERKAASHAVEALIPPTQIPPSTRFMGIPLEVFMPGEAGAEGDMLKGVAASPGTVTGRAQVLHGPEDFDQMRQGDILVAKITTPAWTPLFAMAGGIVTDIGGPLSHGSIVAREYGIPAVLGTVNGSRVIHTDQQVTVDGDAGLVTVYAEE